MLTKRDIQYFDVATTIARVSNHRKARLGAVIVSGRDVIAAAPNVNKSHPMQMRYNSFRNMEGDNHNHHLHAEMATIIRVPDKRKLDGASIYVSRVCKDREYGMARPCPACMQAIIDHGIKRIFYSTEYGFAQEVINN